MLIVYTPLILLVKYLPASSARGPRYVSDFRQSSTSQPKLKALGSAKPKGPRLGLLCRKGIMPRENILKHGYIQRLLIYFYSEQNSAGLL